MFKNNEVADEHLREIAEVLARQDGISDAKIMMDPGTLKGDNYMGVITCIDISGTGTDGNPKKLHLIGKSAISNENLRKEINTHNIYDREIFVYQELFRIYENLQRDQGLGEPFRGYPKCVYASLVEPNELLVMENLRIQGYGLCDRKGTMNPEHARLVLETYGRFHALSFALKELEPNVYERLAVKFEKHPFATDVPKIKAMLALSFGQAIGLFEGDQDGQDIVALLTDCKDTLNCDELFEKSDDSIAIAHGDCWTNNMMFLYGDSKNPSKPTSLKLLDFQGVHLDSPARDLVHYLFCCCSEEVLDDIDNLLLHYYDSFSAQLRALSVKPEEVFTLEELQGHMKRHARYGFLLAVSFVKMMISEVNDIPDMEKMANEGQDIFETMNFKTSNEDEYKRRLTYIARHLIRRGY